MHADKFHRLNSSDIALAWNIIDKQQISLNKKKIDNAIDFFFLAVLFLLWSVQRLSHVLTPQLHTNGSLKL